MRLFVKCFMLFALPALFLSGCKKENNEEDPEHYVKLKVDGTWRTYKEGFGLVVPGMTSVDSRYFTGTFISEDGKESFTFSMRSLGDFATGTYDSDLGFTDMYVQYSKETPAVSKDYELQTIPGIIPPHFVFTITKVTATSIEGHFTGNYLYTDINYEPITVTEGEFRAKLEP